MSKRTRLSGLVDVVRIDDPALIATLATHPALDRAYEPIGPWFNRVLARRIIANFTFPKGLAPTMRAKDDPVRQQVQAELYARLSSPDLATQDWHKAGVAALVDYLHGRLDHDGMGAEMQQLVGRCFDPSYQATADTWLAAQEFDGAARATSPFAWASDAITGTRKAALTVLSEAAAGDPAAIHATGIAVHNLVAAMKRLHRAFHDPAQRDSLDAPRALSLSLAAPASVLRQVKEAFDLPPFGTLERGTLVVFQLEDAIRESRDRRIAFMLSGWSACPAEGFAGDLISRIWTAALAAPQEAASSRYHMNDHVPAAHA